MTWGSMEYFVVRVWIPFCRSIPYHAKIRKAKSEWLETLDIGFVIWFRFLYVEPACSVQRSVQ